MTQIYTYVLWSNKVLRIRFLFYGNTLQQMEMALALLWWLTSLRNHKDPVSTSQQLYFRFLGWHFDLEGLIFVLRVSWKVKPSAGNIVPQKHLYRIRIDHTCPQKLIRDQITVSLRSYLRSRWDRLQVTLMYPDYERWFLVYGIHNL